MKKNLIATLLFTLCLNLSAQDTKEAVKEVILSAYVNGIHNGGPIKDIKKGFHEDFIMHAMADNGVNEITIQSWLENIEKSRNRPGYDPSARPKSTAEFTNVSVNGNSAIAELNLIRNGKKVFTDYLALYKFNEGWKIVSKTFYRWP